MLVVMPVTSVQVMPATSIQAHCGLVFTSIQATVGLNTSPASKKKSRKQLTPIKKKVVSTPAGLNTSEARITEKQ